MTESPTVAPPEPRLPLERWGRRLLSDLQARADHTRVGRWAFEFLMFGLKQGWACVFGGLMLALLFATHLVWPAGAPIARYDFVVIAAVAIQAGMLLFKLESWEEVRVIYSCFYISSCEQSSLTSAKGEKRTVASQARSDRLIAKT